MKGDWESEREKWILLAVLLFVLGQCCIIVPALAVLLR